MRFPTHARLAAGLLLSLGFAVHASAADAASAARYLEDVKVLAATDMKGRGAGTPELDRAADYIAAEFERLGLKPAGEHGYFQPFQVTTGAEMGPHNSLTAENLNGEKKLTPGKDWVPINFSSSGEVEGEVVFAGYGISAKEMDYDDYFHFDVADKIVIVLRYEPATFQKEKTEQARRQYTHHANLIAKAINARNRGAKAVILVNGKRPNGGEDELIQFGSTAGPDNAGIPMIQVKSSIVEGWLRRSGKSLKLLQRDIDGKGEPLSLALADNFKLHLKVDVERKQATVKNVAAYLPGKTDEYVVLGAHYDHLGLGDESSLAPDKIGEVHHGADDNASGTAGVLELARRFSGQERGERGLLFLTFAGEEIGLLGSQHWVENPTKPLDKAVAMLNMDMIGRIAKDKVYVGGVGTAEGFDALVKQAAADTEFQVDFSNSGYSASDHTSFTAKRIPVLFFFSGLHGDYHKPSDTWDKINAPQAVELLDMIARIAVEIRDEGDRPQFSKAAEDSGNPHGGSAPSGSGGGGYGPYFGSIPDFAEVPNGVRFADIRPGSPAEKGGIQAGDILTGWNGKPIQNLYDFTYALRDSKVGDVVAVTLLRGSETVETKVTLEQRR
ncbi:MAG: M28 family peptidase [Acidobacteria bacterium]|nr:M28 family peptidase [Acidobacteriota bacterium]